MFVAIVEPFEQFEHAAFGIVVAKVLLDPGNRFFGRAHALIEPGSELLDLGLAQPGRIADIVEGG